MIPCTAMYTETEFATALEKVKAEFETRTGGSCSLSFRDTNDFRMYAKSRTDIRSDDLNAEQAAWKLLYDSA